MITIEKMFESAIQLRDKGDLRDAVEILSKILADFSNDSRISGVHSVLGGVYYELEEHEKAFEHFKQSTILSPKS